MRQAAVSLSAADIEEPLHEVRFLSSNLLDISLAQLVAQQDQPMKQEHYDIMNAAIERRVKHVPAAYIIGSCGFYGREFSIGPGVLIPRADTEVLVEQVIKRSSVLPERIRLLDTFTGSGCIGITLALELINVGHKVDLYLADISEQALEFTRLNVARHEISESCQIFQADIWPDIDNKWHIVTANPPYICNGVIDDLQPEVRENEPIIALDGGSDGLHFYHNIFVQASDKILPGGLLACEHGYDQAYSIRQIAESYGWNSIYQYNDFGGNPRVTICDK